MEEIPGSVFAMESCVLKPQLPVYLRALDVPVYPSGTSVTMGSSSFHFQKYLSLDDNLMTLTLVITEGKVQS